jgi:lipopolysaccharide heptosyltransferase I
MNDAKHIPLSEYKAHRIALIKPSSLGDIAHSLPVLTALRQRFPTAHIAWVVNRSFAPLLQDHPDLDEVIRFDRRPAKSRWPHVALNWIRFLRRLRREEFNLVIDLQGLARSGIMTAATRAPRRVGLGTAREGARFAYTDVIPVPTRTPLHAVDRYWLVMEALGAADCAKQFRVPISDEARRWALDALREFPRPWLVFGVGARWETKRWLPAHFADLASRAQRRWGGTIAFIGGADETALAAEVRKSLPGQTLDWTGKTTLPQLAAILESADVVVANDTGPLHLAVALGRPVVAPYTCTQIARTGPYGAELNAVETTVWCRGSCIRQCSRLDCMADLTPDRLWPILERHLSAWESKRLSA